MAIAHVSSLENKYHMNLSATFNAVGKQITPYLLVIIP